VANVYDVGDGVRLTGTFTISGSGTNPTTATLTVTDPSEVVTTPAVGTGTDGVYLADIIIDEPGAWHYQWKGTGAVVAATEGHFFVRKRRSDE
jgi:hypothetical protein